MVRLELTDTPTRHTFIRNSEGVQGLFITFYLFVLFLVAKQVELQLYCHVNATTNDIIH